MAMSGIEVIDAVEAYNAMKSSRSTQRLKVYMIAKDEKNHPKMLEDPEFAYPEGEVQQLEERAGDGDWKEKRKEVDRLIIEKVKFLIQNSWKDKCRLIIIDLLGGSKADVHVLSWTAEGASVREKMTFASTFQAVKAKCDGCSNHSGEAHELDEFEEYLTNKKIAAAM